MSYDDLEVIDESTEDTLADMQEMGLVGPNESADAVEDGRLLKSLQSK